MSTLARISDCSEELTIIINEDQPDLTAKFTVPETLLTETSEYFSAASRNAWTEATSRIIKLSDIDVDAFRAYLFWVYRRQINVQVYPEGDRLLDTKIATAIFNDLASL